MGQKRGRDEGSFVRETGVQTVAFYRDIVQNLKAWYAAAPKLRAESDDQTVAAEPEQPLVPAWGRDDSPALPPQADDDQGTSAYVLNDD